MMNTPFARATSIVLASLGLLALPVPATAQDYTQLRQCYANCYEAYVVMTQQPIFHSQCRTRCYQMYGEGTSAVGLDNPLAVTRYD